MREMKGFQKGQTICYSDKGLISLIEPSRFTFETWEIYCLDGNLFDDIDRFETKELALAKCREYLDITLSIECENES